MSTAASTQPPRATLLSVGDELLAGDIVDTNRAHLGRRCRELGLEVRHGASVRDREEEIAAAIEAAARAGDAVCLVSGGLGPTTDDLTAAAVARAAGVPLERDPEALADIEAKFRAFGRPMAPSNAKQADLPRGSERLDNPIGTAPGFLTCVGSCRVFAMPGVPREMKKMLEEQVVPRLQATFDLPVVARRIYRALGMGESSLAGRIEGVLASARERGGGLAHMFVHYRASYPQVSVVVEGTPGPDGTGASVAELESLDAPLAAALAPALYGIGEAELPARLIHVLAEAGATFALAESCTGGGASAMLAAVPGASRALAGSVVSYSNAVKTRVLGVPAELIETHGAVSEAVARAMADGARERTGADLAVAITGIAGPSGGSPEKPVGTVDFAVTDAEAASHRRLTLRGNRGTVQRAAALWALKFAWDRLVERDLARVFELD